MKLTYSIDEQIFRTHSVWVFGPLKGKKTQAAPVGKSNFDRLKPLDLVGNVYDGESYRSFGAERSLVLDNGLLSRERHPFDWRGEWSGVFESAAGSLMVIADYFGFATNFYSYVNVGGEGYKPAWVGERA